MNLKDNPAFQVAFTSQVHSLNLYMPKDVSKYHMSRYMAGGAQNIYSGAGSTREFLEKMAGTVKGWCNDTISPTDSIRTDIGTMMDNLLYRLKYPIDEHCSLRMGAIFCFMEHEDPDKVHDHFTREKVAMAIGNYEKGIEGDPELYTFFLTTGLGFTQAYSGLLDTSIDTDYFSQREAVLQSMLPQVLQTG